MKPVRLSDKKSMFRSFVFVSFLASSFALPSIALAQEGTPQGASTPIRSQRRFALMAEAGWNTPEIVSGTPNEAQRQAFQLLYGNGISLGLALGYAF
jgi:hypothetical protein